MLEIEKKKKRGGGGGGGGEEGERGGGGGGGGRVRESRWSWRIIMAIHDIQVLNSVLGSSPCIL